MERIRDPIEARRAPVSQLDSEAWLT